MKLKRIFSSALVVVMLFGAIVGAYPIAASAAYSANSNSSALNATANLTADQVTEYLTKYLSYDFSTAEELIEAELDAGYLYSVNSANQYYTLYVNKYSGMVYYKNNVTGQILTSNPVNPGYDNGAVESGERENLMKRAIREDVFI